MEDKIINLGNGHWCSEQMLKDMQKFEDKIFKNFIFRKPEITKQRNEDKKDLKYAFIYQGKTHKMVMIDIKTNKAYKLDGYSATDIEITNYKFDRWCTSFDL